MPLFIFRIVPVFVFRIMPLQKLSFIFRIWTLTLHVKLGLLNRGWFENVKVNCILFEL